MSILNNSPARINEISPDVVANRILNQTKLTFDQMVHAFNNGSRIFWKNPKGFTPAEIASSLGTNAKEVFELHYALGQFVASIKPEAIQEGLSLVGQFTINDDGTVTIQEENTNDK